MLQTNHQKIETIITKLGLKVPPHLLKTKDGKALCHVLMTHWLPLSPTVLQAVVDQLPSPLHCQAQRMTKLFQPPIPPHLLHCASDGPTIVLVSKMFSVSKALLPGQRRGQLSAEEMRARRAAIIQKLKAQEPTDTVQEDVSMISLDTLSLTEGEAPPEESEEEKTAETLIAFARVFSGTLRRGQPMICLHPSFDPQRPEEHRCAVTVGDLYLLMGRDLEALEEVPAGNIVGIGGLGDVVLKSATLVSSIEEGKNLAAASDMQSNMADGKGIVRVAIEPENPGTTINTLSQRRKERLTLEKRRLGQIGAWSDSAECFRRGCDRVGTEQWGARHLHCGRIASRALFARSQRAICKNPLVGQ